MNQNRKVVRAEKPTWTPEQARNILADLPEHHRALFTCASFTGLRGGELLALKWANVNFEEQTIRVQNSLWNGHAIFGESVRNVRENTNNS